MQKHLIESANNYLNVLCKTIDNRAVGSAGNLKATDFFYQELSVRNWSPERQEFEAMDWEDGGAELTCGEQSFKVCPSPYATGCRLNLPLVAASDVQALESVNATGKILLLHGSIAREQLMPKNFVFYNPEEHRRIVAALEKSGAEAIITATGRNSALAGGLYPFPMIEDGDFNIPSVFMTEEEGRRLSACFDQNVMLHSKAWRHPSHGYNISGKKGKKSGERIIVTAHIDAKKGTPGAIDNATGIIVLLLLAELLKNYEGSARVELLALNGEDYFAVPGQMKFISINEGRFHEIKMNINIDGAGYREGGSELSFYGIDNSDESIIKKIIEAYPDISVGQCWPQGDHSIFVQYGCPAIAASSAWLINHMETQDITHTSRDEPGIVDTGRLVSLAEAMAAIITALGR